MEQTDFDCPSCGQPLMENDLLFVCSKEKAEDNTKCEFKIWKKSKLLNEEIDDLIFSQMNSAEGYAFDRGIIRIAANNPPFFTSVEWNNSGGNTNFPVNKDFHLLEITTKDNKQFSIWKQEIENEEDDRLRKSVFKNFLGHDITEEEAKKLFNDEIVSFAELTSRAGKTFSANGKLEFNEEKQNWGINLIFDNESN